MKTSLSCLLAALCLSLLPLGAAQAEGGFVTAEFGKGDVEFDRPELLPFDPVGDPSDNTLALAISGGYLFPSGVFADISYTDVDTINLFGVIDVFGFSSTKLGVGYRWKTNEHFAFLAKTGFSRWDLDVREGFFLTPGPEESIGFDGTDVFFEFGAEYIIGERFGLTLVHTRESYDLGDTSSTRFGVRYFFGGP